LSEHVEELISAYIDEELLDTEQKKVEAHLNSCEECHRLMSSMLSLKEQVFVSYQSIEAPHHLEQQIMERIEHSVLEQTQLHQLLWVILIPPVLLISMFFFFFSKSFYFGAKVVSTMFKMLLGLFHILSIVFSITPYLMTSLILFASVILLGSIWSLRHLLLKKRPEKEISQWALK
jgi:predicted anti-sigma-YlaC factor YlaD